MTNARVDNKDSIENMGESTKGGIKAKTVGMSDAIMKQKNMNMYSDYNTIFKPFCGGIFTGHRHEVYPIKQDKYHPVHLMETA